MNKKVKKVKKAATRTLRSAAAKTRKSASKTAARLTIAAEDAVLNAAHVAERMVEKRRTRRTMAKAGRVLKTIGTAVAVAAASAGAAVMAEKVIKRGRLRSKSAS